MKRKSSVLAAVQKNGTNLEDAPDDLKADKEVVMLAVGNRGDALEFAAKRLQSDKDVVLAAVRQRGAALQFAAKTLRADRDVVATAVLNSNFSGQDPLVFASPQLQRDKHLVLAAVKANGTALEHASAHLKADKEMWLQRLWGRTALHCSTRLLA